MGMQEIILMVIFLVWTPILNIRFDSFTIKAYQYFKISLKVLTTFMLWDVLNIAALQGCCLNLSVLVKHVFFVIFTLARTSNKKREDIPALSEKEETSLFHYYKSSKERTVNRSKLKDRLEVRQTHPVFFVWSIY